MYCRSDVLTYAVIIAIVLGVVTSYFFLAVDKESYSALYIIPDSTNFDSANNTVSFEYGVRSFETGSRDYTLKIYSANVQLNNKNFSLNPGRIVEEPVKISLPSNTRFPVKISLKLTTGTSSEEVHFWLT
jgi:hypothetical protein